MNLVAVLEGLLFLRGEEGISVSEIRDILNVDDKKLREIIFSLQDNYLKEDRGIQIEKYGDVLKLTTKREHLEFYQKLIEIDETKPLSQAALESLAIIAYNTPITRISVDEIRGVSSAHLVRNLVNRGLVEITGKSEKPGKPNLYGVTNLFLDKFGLRNLEELPAFEQIDLEEEETDLFNSRYKEETI